MNVIVVTSTHSDITPGDIGTVTGRKGKGYVVKLTKRFQDAAHTKREETREIWFPPGAIKLTGEQN